MPTSIPVAPTIGRWRRVNGVEMLVSAGFVHDGCESAPLAAEAVHEYLHHLCRCTLVEFQRYQGSSEDVPKTFSLTQLTREEVGPRKKTVDIAVRSARFFPQLLMSSDSLSFRELAAHLPDSGTSPLRSTGLKVRIPSGRMMLKRQRIALISRYRRQKRVTTKISSHPT